MKVERPRARSSDAPTRENSRSTMPIVAEAAGTNEPVWARIAIRAFWRRNVDLPPIFGPVSSQIAPPSASPLGDRLQSFGTNGCSAALRKACSTTGWRPCTILNAVESSTLGRHHPSVSARSAKPCATSMTASAAAAFRIASASLMKALAKSSKMPSSMASALSAADAIFSSRSASSVVVKRMALAMVWRWMNRPLASGVPFIAAAWLAVTSM